MSSIHHQLGASTTNLCDMISENIKAAILDGTLKSGQLLTAAEVSDWLGVSRTPVREAFMLLCEWGLLDKDSSRSYVVARGNKTDILELAQLRVTLESLAIELAMQNYKPEDIDVLESIVMQMESASKRGDNPRLVDLDLQFHIQLWRMAGNSRLEQMLEKIRIQVNYFMLITRVGDEFDYPRTHQDLIDNLKSGNVERAKEDMRIHIMSIASRTIARLETD